MKNPEPPPHVALITIVCGYNEKQLPGFAAAVVGGTASYEYFGRPKTFEEKMAVLREFSDWKNQVGPKIREIELNKGSACLFFRDILDVPGPIATEIDLSSYYAGVMGHRMPPEHTLYAQTGINDLARRQARLYELLYLNRFYVPKSADFLAQIQRLMGITESEYQHQITWAPAHGY